MLLGDVHVDRRRRANAAARWRRHAVVRLSDRWRRGRRTRTLAIDEWAERRARPEDAGRCAGDPPTDAAGVRGGRARAATRPRSAICLTFAIIGGGPTGVELAGALAEIARHTLRREFDTIDPESARIVLIEGGPDDSAGVSRVAARFGASARCGRLGVEVWENAVVTSVEHERAARSAQRPRDRAHDPLGRRCRRPRRSARRLGVELDRAGRIVASTGPVGAGTPGDLRRRRSRAVHASDRQAAAGRGAGGQAAGARMPRRTCCAGSPGEPTTPFRYRDPGNMATIGRAARDRRLRLGARVRLSRLADVAVRAHPVLDRLPQSPVGDAAMGDRRTLTYQRSVRLITGDREADVQVEQARKPGRRLASALGDSDFRVPPDSQPRSAAFRASGRGRGESR